MPTTDEPPIFVIGNAYDHRDVAETIALLAGAFPKQPIVALGPVGAPTPRVTVLESSTATEAELHRVYASARLVIVPSLYEGVGFRMVTALAYGRTLLARASTLLQEIAGRCAPRGRIVPYERREDLVEIVGRILQGEAAPEVPQRGALARARSQLWPDIADAMAKFAAGLTRQSPQSSWPATRSAVLAMASAAEGRTDVAELVATVLDRFMTSGDFVSYFRLLQSRGIHVTPVHFYSPIPDTSALGDAPWARETAMPGIDLVDAQQLALLNAFVPFQQEYDAIPLEPTGRPGEYCLHNPMFGGTDALVLYCMVRHFKPASIVEVGGGYSTRLLVDASARNGRTRITSIEPHPDAVLKTVLPIELIERPVQEVPVAHFEALVANDLLFIDSSHAVRIGGDVPYLFLEVLPRLAPGVIVHVHDIFLPRAQPREWVVDHLQFWCEQDLLQAFLAFNRDF